MCKVSVIVPVYNTEKYLSRCIDSVLGQSFAYFELLLVDDGSTDNCGVICDEYAAKDSRVRVFHKENGGVSSARNVGLDNARGEWITFVDSDDELMPDGLKVLMENTSDEVDLVYGEIRKFDDKNDNLETIKIEKLDSLSVEQTLDTIVAPKRWNGDWHRYVNNRILRRSIVEKFGLRFNTKIYYKEDGLFVVQYVCRCKGKIICVPEVYYLYRQIDSSALGRLSNSYNPKLLTNVDAHRMIYKELKKLGVKKEIRSRELAHLFQNYDWISGIMQKARVYNFKNRRALLKKTIKNGGLVNFIHYRIILYYGRTLKSKLS